MFFSDGEQQAGVRRTDFQVHGVATGDLSEDVSVQQRPGRGEKASDARSWAKRLPGRRTGSQGPRQELGAEEPRCHPPCFSHPSFFSVSALLSFSQSHGTFGLHPSFGA